MVTKFKTFAFIGNPEFSDFLEFEIAGNSGKTVFVVIGIMEVWISIFLSFNQIGNQLITLVINYSDQYRFVEDYSD